jgi:hypothetical protein
MLWPPRQIDLGRSAQFALFDEIDCVGGGCQTLPRAIADLDEDEALGVQHDEVYFAQAATKIAFNRIKPPLLQVSEG